MKCTTGQNGWTSRSLDLLTRSGRAFGSFRQKRNDHSRYGINILQVLKL